MPIERIQRIAGRAIPLRGDNVDTDRIIPARFLKSITFAGLEQHLFEDDRQQLEAEGQRHPIADPKYRGARILLVNANFGCGSSREHAPQAIRRSGIEVVVGQSFSEIFFGNSVALGMPCVSADQSALDTLMAAVESDPALNVDVDLESMTVRAGGRSFSLTLPPGARESFLDGSWDATGLLLDRFEEVEATAARLPYLHWS
ncbi:MAG: 3-isopropylmalate/(R)-2-methylmalate dehydratase small subunit [Acidobacteriota bacterium]|jgi:3-isopropylmalate/(R)-2-methylmalate dehydratase small subunit